MIIKVCGMRDAENIREVEVLRPDWMGFIFWPRSKRCVRVFPEYMPIYCKRVGVFVDEDVEQVKRIADDYALDLIQLHGSESPNYVRKLREWEVIKAFNIATADDLQATAAYEGVADYFLFDARCPVRGDVGVLPGGTGQQFDWSVLSAYDGSTPYLLSGGIGPDDAPRLRTFFETGSNSAAGKCIGVDLNSRFELSPGVKGVDSLRRFLTSLRGNQKIH